MVVAAPASRARSTARVACAATLLLAACASSGKRPDLDPLPADGHGYALVCGKVLTVDGDDRIFSPGLILVKEGRIAYVGEKRDVPRGYEVIELDTAWATPGMIDLHSHVHTGSWGDINDSVLPLNPQLRASAGLRPSNPSIRRACAGGVTTLFGIPGSGSSLSGFGIVYKTKTHARFDDIVVREPGGMKVAQSYNPERGQDLGATRAGLGWMLENLSDRAIGATREERDDPALANLQKVHSKELPMLIHCAGSDGFANAARMWKGKYDTRCVLSHGCFDAHFTGPFVVELGAPVNAGPRTMDFFSTRDGAITGTVKRYLDAGSQDLSLNTDSPVVPQEELFLQGAMSARLGADGYQMLRACTIHPARVFGLDERVGSLEVGKDADVVVRSGNPLDPRARVELVLIDGHIEYDRKRDGQWF